MTESSERLKVQVEFTPEAHAQFQEMKKLSGARSKVATIRNALRVFFWFLRQRADGWKLHISKDGTVKEVDLMM